MRDIQGDTRFDSNQPTHASCISSGRLSFKLPIASAVMHKPCQQCCLQLPCNELQRKHTFSISTRSGSPFCFGMMSVLMLKEVPSADKVPPNSPMVSMFRFVLAWQSLRQELQHWTHVYNVCRSISFQSAASQLVTMACLSLPCGQGLQWITGMCGSTPASAHRMKSSMRDTDTCTSRTPSNPAGLSSGEGVRAAGEQHWSPAVGDTMSTCSDITIHPVTLGPEP